MMAPKKRKRQSIRENAANAVAGAAASAAASAGKTPSQLATWMERVFLLCESACAESDASLSCSWQFKFLWFVVCEILMRLFLMFLSVEIPMKKNSSASWSLGGISARKWPSMRWCCSRATWNAILVACWTLDWSILLVSAEIMGQIWGNMAPRTSGTSGPKSFPSHQLLLMYLCKHEGARTYNFLWY